MELVPSQHQNYIHNLFHIAVEDVAHGVVSATTKERIRLFNNWKQWLHTYIPKVSPSLEQLNPPARVKLLAAYGAHVRNRGFSSSKHKARSQTVALAFRAISTTMQLEAKFNPLATSQNKYPKAISQLLEAYKRQDPPSQPKLAIPVMIPEYIQLINSEKSDKHDAIGDLCIIAFYYLLRVGEYTYHRPLDRRRTQQFRLQDVAFWKNNKRLSPTLSIKHLLKCCTAATLSISNQ